MTHATQSCKQFMYHKRNKKEVIQVSIVLLGNLTVLFCFGFFKEITPAFLMANTFTLLILLKNTFFKY